MDSRITIKFFRISNENGIGPAFEDVLLNIIQAAPTPKERKKEINPEVVIRLERLNDDKVYLSGEVVRKQIANIPQEANDDGLTPLKLTDGAGLGHSIAFCYHKGLRVVAIQFDRRAVSVARFLKYITICNDGAYYKAYPLVRDDAWERYNKGTLRKFEFKIASPSALDEIEGSVGSVAESSRRLTEVFEAPVIRFEVSMGRRKGSLARQAVEHVIKFFTSGDGRLQDVQTMKAVTKGDDGEIANVNFIEDDLILSEAFNLPQTDPDKHYESKYPPAEPGALRLEPLEAAGRSITEPLYQFWAFP